MAARQEWYKLAGMSLNNSKTKIMGFGFTPDPLDLGDVTIEPSSSMKFLGFEIQNNLGQDLHVNAVATKIRHAAAQIRANGRNFRTSDRRRLYMGLVQGHLCSNGSTYLPLLSKSESEILQTACNAAIRSVAKLPRKSWDISISDVRKKLNIPSVQALADKAILMQAWKFRSQFVTDVPGGPETRSHSNGNVPHPDQKGWLGKMIVTQAKRAYNTLPKECKECNSLKKAKLTIMKLIKANNS